MGSHRAPPTKGLRARYGRIALALVSLSVTVVALLGGVGVIPVDGGARIARDVAGGLGQGAGQDTRSTGGRGDAARSADAVDSSSRLAPTALPSGTGSGRRVVFSQSAQRVWLVGDDDRVESTYLVSGSVVPNLRPGTYAVFSRSRWAVGVDDSGVMQYFVRFAHGPEAAIGFHSIPTKHGSPLQSVAQLGTPQSHGCIRQRLADAQRMWDFARVGTDVVVV